MITVIFEIPMWWIFLWVNICLRLQWFCFSYESRCILCTLFLFMCFDPHMYEGVWGGTCALVGVTGGGECGESDRSSAIQLGILPLLCCLTRDKKEYHATGDVGDIATSPWLDLACSYFNFMSWYLKLYSNSILIITVLWFSSHLGGV